MSFEFIGLTMKRLILCFEFEYFSDNFGEGKVFSLGKGLKCFKGRYRLFSVSGGDRFHEGNKFILQEVYLLFVIV